MTDKASHEIHTFRADQELRMAAKAGSIEAKTAHLNMAAIHATKAEMPLSDVEHPDD